MTAALSSTYGLSEKVTDFVCLMAEGHKISEAAAESGVGPRYAYGLMRNPSVQAALNAELRRKLAGGAPVALSTLIEVVSDKKVSAGVRVKAAGMILDRAGFVAPRALPAGSGVDKTLNEMSIDELKDLAAKLENEIVGRAKTINAPASEPAPSQAADILD